MIPLDFRFLAVEKRNSTLLKKREPLLDVGNFMPSPPAPDDYSPLQKGAKLPAEERTN